MESIISISLGSKISENLIVSSLKKGKTLFKLNLQSQHTLELSSFSQDLISQPSKKPSQIKTFIEAPLICRLFAIIST